MDKRIPTSVLSIIKATQEKGEKLTTLTCRMTGSFKPGTKAIIFPGEKEFLVKEITEIENNNYSVKVKGIPFKSCIPFAVITPVDLKVKYSKRAYFIPSDFHGKDFIPGEYDITGGIFEGYRLFNRDKYKAKVKKIGNMYSADFPFKSPIVPGAEFAFENKKGFKGQMKLIYPGYLDKKSENSISARMNKFRFKPGVKGIYSIILRTDNYVELPSFLLDEEFDGALKMGNVRVMEREYDSLKNKILKQSKASGGILFGTLKKNIKATHEFFHGVVKKMIEDELVFINDDHLIFNGSGQEDFLSPLAKDGYQQIIEAGITGLSVRTIKNHGMVRCFQEIKRMKLAYVLDDDLYYSKEAFNKLLVKIFTGKSIGDKLSIQDIRDSSGLSRRYIISLLNSLEDEMVIEREINDDRIIKKFP